MILAFAAASGKAIQPGETASRWHGLFLLLILVPHVALHRSNGNHGLVLGLLASPGS
jgi:hypothetical protein